MKLLLDMNLSPEWARFLEQEGFEAVHWASVGSPTASDADIMEWARQRHLPSGTHVGGLAHGGDGRFLRDPVLRRTDLNAPPEPR